VSESCLYEGSIQHRRFTPHKEFRHKLALAYVDLDELPELLDGRLIARGPGIVRFRRGDYLGDAQIPLDDAVRDTVLAQTGHRPQGPIRLLSQLRTFGHCFNPVSFYYCFSPEGDSIEAVVAEVNNTPWGERHAYVLPGNRGEFDKRLHVSPFMGMNQSYAARASTPGDALSVHIENHEGGEKVFDATLSVRRVELTRANLRAITRRYPLATGRVLALIYGHAVGLKIAGARYHPHPGRAAA
jgi:uncharacterized protein